MPETTRPPFPYRRGCLLVFVILCSLVNRGGATDLPSDIAPQPIKFATLNASLYREMPGELLAELKGTESAQAKKLASMLQVVRPDVLLLGEIDGEDQQASVLAFRDNYLAKGQGELQPLHYPYVYQSPVNTGLASGLDLNGNKDTTEPEDAWGFGRYHGQYAFAVYSRFPIDLAAIRTFQNFRWSQMPGALRPRDPKTGASYYPDAIWQQLRLSSKNHIDVPIQVGKRVKHLLACHPTPPAFDGPEDRNGCRNHDEIRFWVDYLTEAKASYIQDDLGQRGGLAADQSFVIMGDLNADPQDGAARREAIQGLLGHSRLVDPRPRSVGATESKLGRKNQTGNPAESTAQFSFGNLRVDYVLPSTDLRVIESGVFWPESSHAHAAWLDATDHRLVWVLVQ